jgi:hypothetical protein
MKISYSIVAALMLVTAPAIAADAMRGRPKLCLYNCPPAVGGISAPAQVGVPAGGMGTVTIRWSWSQSRSRPVLEYGCLWVSAVGEANAHAVQCERPGNYTITLPWIGAGGYVFSSAPGNANGPTTRPVGALHPFAQTTVTGVAQ